MLPLISVELPIRCHIRGREVFKPVVVSLKRQTPEMLVCAVVGKHANLVRGGRTEAAAAPHLSGVSTADRAFVLDALQNNLVRSVTLSTRSHIGLLWLRS